MRRLSFNPAAAVVLILSASPAALGQSDLLTRWVMASSVFENDVHDADYCESPLSQLDCSTHVVWGLSVSEQYCRGWFSDRLLVFSGNIWPRAAGAKYPLTVSTYGRLWLNPAVESTLTFDFNCMYRRPAGYRTVLIGFQLYTYESQTTFYFNENREATPAFDPPIGSLELADEIVLPPFPTGYVLRYDVRLSSYTGSPTELTVADATLPIVLEPTVCRPCGDLNCDGVVDDSDVPAFMLALLDPAAYAAAYSGCDRSHADMNGDGSADGLDISEMILRLTAH